MTSKCSTTANLLFLIILAFVFVMYLNAAGTRAPGATGLEWETARADSAPDTAESSAYGNASAVKPKTPESARALESVVLKVDAGGLSSASLNVLEALAP